MIFELVGFIGIITLVLIALSEQSKTPVIGIAGSILLLILGFSILIDGIEIKTGETQITTGGITTTGTELAVADDNETTTTINLIADNNETTTTTYTYSEPTVDIGGNNLIDALGILFIILSIVGILRYSIEVGK